MNVVHPANVMNFYFIMIPIVMFDILSDLPWFEPYFRDFDMGDWQNNIRDQMADLGYDTHNPLINLKTLVVLQMLYLSRIAVLFGVLYPLKKYYKGYFQKFFRNSYKALKGTLIFSEILAILFGSLLELMIAGILFLNIPESNPNNTIRNKIVSIYFMIIPLVLIPAVFFWMFTKNLKHIQSHGFQKKWGILTDEISLKHPG